MRKILFILLGVFMFGFAFAAGENVPTSKGYVDSKLGEKQDNITATDAPRAIMNTGVAGEYDTRGIYDSTGEYSDQTRALVDAATMNAGVQNAINSEFQCIEWVDPNDHSSDCLLFNIFGQTERRSPNLFDVSKIPERVTYGTLLINNGDGSLTATGSATNSAVYTKRKLSELAPGLVAGKKYTLSLKTTAGSNWPQADQIALINESVSPRRVVSWMPGRTIQIDQGLLDSGVYFQAPTTRVPNIISDIQITEGTTAMPYVPYGNIYMPAAE